MPKHPAKRRRGQRGGDLRDTVIEKYARNKGVSREEGEKWADANWGKKESRADRWRNFGSSFIRGAQIARRAAEEPAKAIASNPTNLVNPLFVAKAAKHVVGNVLKETGGTTGSGRKRRKR